MEEKKVYVICYDSSDEFILYHIASTEERAKEWIRENHPNDNLLEIVEWTVDGEER